MEDTLTLGELGIVVVGQENNPSILNPDFLRYNDIVPKEWEVAEPPVCVGPVSEVVFKSGMRITAEMARITFIEDVVDKPFDEVLAPSIVERYIATLPHVKYTALGINPKGHVLGVSREEVEGFLLHTLIVDGPWKAVDSKAPLVSVNLVYPLEECRLTMSITPTTYTRNPNQPRPALLFAANFHREVQGTNRDERITNLKVALGAWRQDIVHFTGLVSDFLRKGETQK